MRGMALRVQSSILATDEERQLAQDLNTTLENSPNHGVGEKAAIELARLYARVTAREQGRDAQLVPQDPAQSAAVLDSLSSYTNKLESELTSQISSNTRSRWIWLGVALGSAAVGFDIAVGLPPITYIDVDGTGRVVAGSMALAVTLLAFRIQQVKDATIRRLREKRVSVRFLEMSIDVTQKNPEATGLFERAFEMFSSHHESMDAPIGIKDVFHSP